jgi:hypothetical protein
MAAAGNYFKLKSSILKLFRLRATAASAQAIGVYYGIGE